MAPAASADSERGCRFWTIAIHYSVSSILTVIDGSAISPAMPSMVEDLGSTYAYVWIANAYFLAMTAFQPIYGQTSNIFGCRSLTLAAVFLFAVGVGVAMGPTVGGSLSERVSWRWVFYLNLHIAVAGFIMLIISLKVFAGAASCTPGHRVIQCSGLIPEPTMPLRLFTNRTPLAAFGLTLIHSVLMYWQMYFLPLYIQSVLEVSLATSGVYLLPTVVVFTIFSVVAGTGLSKMGRYSPWRFSGVALFAIGDGIFFLLDENSSTAFCAGGHVELPALLRRYLGHSHTGCDLHFRVDQLVITRLKDENMRALAIQRRSLRFSVRGFIASLNHKPAPKATVKRIYADSLKLAWQPGIGSALAVVILWLIIKKISLRTELETQFGLDDGDGQEVEKGTPVQASDQAIDKEETREESKESY
ncbi:hypothetical protein DL765_003450 [Monosporascus sp. GIB2]|nr:hypothetical protein DL765_003450 [Monosporascus sp. GIB2]